MSERVPVAPLREAFLRSGFSATDAARRLGWVRSRAVNRPDGQRFSRAIGLRRRGEGTLQETTSYERALEIAQVLGVDPVDVGL